VERIHIEQIKARDLPDAWFQCLYNIFDKGYEYTIDRGSFKDQKRLEYDYVVVHVTYPGIRPLIPDIPPGTGVPPPPP
jgi:thymidylate synthase